jgi:hypothetical protein
MRTVLAGFAGGILMFVWSSIAHVALPLGQIGVSTLPHEASSIAAIASAMGDEGGLFIFPDMRPGKPMADKKGSGPEGLLIYQPRGSFEMSPAQLAIEFAKEVVEALIAATLLSLTSLQSYASRLGFVSLVGLVVAIATNVSYWNWYAFPLSYTLSYGVIQLLGYVAAGLAIAWVVPTRSP